LTAISEQLRARLAEQTANEVPLSAGEIYFHMLQCDPEDDEAIDYWQAQIQTSNSSKEVRQLFARNDLNAAFRQLSRSPAHGRFMLAGNIRALLGVKSDEEIRHYLSHIDSAWSYFFDGDTVAMSKLDPSSIEKLQLRSPSNCLKDRQALQPLIEDGSILAGFTLLERRENWNRILSYRRLIPSLYTFFEDLKYHRILVRCLTQLVKPSRRQTVRQAFRAAFDIPWRPNAETFDLAYRRVCLFVMRHIEDLRPGAVRLEREDGHQSRKKNLHVEHDLAREAHRLGFRSEEINGLLSSHPDRAEARDALLRARKPDEFAYPKGQLDAYIDRIVGLFDKAERVHVDVDAPRLVVGGSQKGDVDRRCGRPYRLDHEESAPYLTLENVHASDCAEIGNLTAFYTRRNVYLAFFGPYEDEMMSDICRPESHSVGDEICADLVTVTSEEAITDILPDGVDQADNDHDRLTPQEESRLVLYSPSRYSEVETQYTVNAYQHLISVQRLTRSRARHQLVATTQKMKLKIRHWLWLNLWGSSLIIRSFWKKFRFET